MVNWQATPTLGCGRGSCGATMGSTQVRFHGSSRPFLLRYSSKPPNEGVFFAVEAEKSDDDLHKPFTFKLVPKTKKKVGVQTHIPNHHQQLPCLVLPPSYFAAARQMTKPLAAAPQSKCSTTDDDDLVVHEEIWDDDSERDGDEDEDDYYYCFYSLENKRVEGVKNHGTRLLAWERNHLLPRDALCVGSSHGWVAYFNPNAALNCPFYLFKHPPLSSHNFFSDSEMFRLPPIETLPLVEAVRTRKADHDHHRRRCSNIATSTSVTRDYLFCSDDEITDHDIIFAWTAEEMAGTIIRKLVLSSAPSSDRHSIVVFIRLRGSIAFCKLGDTEWTPLLNPNRDLGRLMDIIYSQRDRRLYALDEYGRLNSWDLTDPASPQYTFFQTKVSPPRLTESEKWLRKNLCSGYNSYLVESSGQLFKVRRFDALRVNKEGGTLSAATSTEPFAEPVRSLHKTIRFDVYRLNSTREKWEAVEGIGDHAFFVGHNHSFSLSTRQFPQLRSNCIYFSDDRPYAIYRNLLSPYHDPDRHYGIGKDTGIFHLEDNTVEHFFDLCYDEAEINTKAVPFWVAPN